MDMIYYGDEEQKARIGFMMMDVAGKGMIYLEDYRNFWIKFFQMYGELLQTKFNYDEESDEVTKMCFELIAKMGSDAANEEDQVARTDGNGRMYFNFEDFKTAKEDRPDLFDWIDEPERYVSEFMKQNTKMNEIQIKFGDYDRYHETVCMAFDQIMDTIDRELQDIDEERRYSITNELQQIIGKNKKVGTIMKQNNFHSSLAKSAIQKNEQNRRATYMQSKKQKPKFHEVPYGKNNNLVPPLASNGGTGEANNSVEEPQFLNDQAAAIEVRRERESTRQGERLTLAEKTVLSMKSKQRTLLRGTNKPKFQSLVKMQHETDEKLIKDSPRFFGGEIIEEQNEQEDSDEDAGIGQLRSTRGVKP